MSSSSSTTAAAAADVTMPTENLHEVSDSSSAAATPPARWSSLYRDALGCIAQYLTLNEFLTAARCCCEWNAHILREGSAPQHFFLKLKGNFFDLLIVSPLHRHIRSIAFGRYYHLQHNVFNTLAANLPHLQSLTCTIDFTIESTTPRHYPRSLTMIALTCDAQPLCGLSQEDAWSRVLTIVDEISRIPTLTEIHLYIDYQPNWRDEFPFMSKPPSQFLAPLTRLKDQLRVFHFISDGVEWTHQHINVMRSFTQLEAITLRIEGNNDILQWYTADPVPSHLRTIQLGFNDSFNFYTAPFLSRLRSLTRFDLVSDLSDLSYLISFPLLEVLELNVRPQPNLLSLTSALTQLHHLHTLEIYVEINSADLCCILAAAPHLHTLRLDHMQHLESLEFATRIPHLAGQLECLTIVHCPAVRTSDELLRLTHLHSLRRLELKDMFDQQFTPSPEVIEAFSLRPILKGREWLLGINDYSGTGARRPRRVDSAAAAAESKKRKLKSEEGEQKRTKREGSEAVTSSASAYRDPCERQV